MEANGRPTDLVAYVNRLQSEAVRNRAVPLTVAQQAARATLRALGGEDLDTRTMYRARRYYWAVVRRSLVRERSAPEVTARFVLAAVAADLASAGRSPLGIYEELVRGWADKVPEGVLEEYRSALCA